MNVFPRADCLVDPKSLDTWSIEKKKNSPAFQRHKEHSAFHIANNFSFTHALWQKNKRIRRVCRPELGNVSVFSSY